MSWQACRIAQLAHSVIAHTVTSMMATSFGHWQFGNFYSRLVCSGEQSPVPAISLNGLKFAFYAQIGSKCIPSSITTKVEDGKSASQASREPENEKVRVGEHFLNIKEH